MDGFIVVDKPAGVTSHDVVAAVRRIIRQKKVGHTGTLDPFATGVLPVAVGEGTKAIPYLDEGVKEYRATMLLGAATDTQDCTGTIIGQGKWDHLTPAEIATKLQSFVGHSTQLPPMFSAVKRNGVPLYRLARKGQEVEREPREIDVYSLTIDAIDLPRVTFTVSCSRGTYVRTLASDMGDSLGCGAHLTELRRLRSGPFTLDKAHSLDELTRLFALGAGHEIVTSPLQSLAHLKTLAVTGRGMERVMCGISPELADFADGGYGEGVAGGDRLCLVWEDRLLAVAESLRQPWGGDAKNLRLIRVFNQD